MVRFSCIFAAVITLAMLSATGVFAVYHGRAVTMRAAPWTVVVKEPGQRDCTGAIIDPLRVLTAGHCIMTDETSTRAMPPTAFAVEAGVSNYKHPLPSDAPQVRGVTADTAMPGYVPGAWPGGVPRISAAGYAHDLAVLTLSRPLDLNGPDAEAVRLPDPDLPEPTASTRIVNAGFGEEENGQTPTGALNRTRQANDLPQLRLEGEQPVRLYDEQRRLPRR